MEENLVIVESPAKANTISNFLGKDFTVKSSFGHIRDLSKDNYGIDIENNYQPEYIIPDDKKKVVSELQAAAKKAKIVWLASDEDREGEAIAWHLAEVLKLNPENTRRIVFHEITSEAILNAVKNPREINNNLVNAQQARRILDRLVGFELSPILWKKIKPSLSAGRVQSVAVRLIVEREKEIDNFAESSYYRIVAQFIYSDKGGKQYVLQAELPEKIKEREKAMKFLQECINADFIIDSIDKKPSTKSPAPPFTTSTLQQEASRKLGFSVAQTMSVAQKLYEAGKITYMRTDSVNLSKTALGAAKTVILSDFGEDYLKTRNFSTKTKGAQEAHEAIRPTYMSNRTVEGKRTEQRLYELIWKRTIASQMSEARIEKTIVKINISSRPDKLVAIGEVLIFDGFLKVYMESKDDEQDESPAGMLPPVKENDPLLLKNMDATQKYNQSPPRYTEASLVKKLEELGIGRPSTYAPTISTIQNRGYVVKEDRPGQSRKFHIASLQEGNIKEKTATEIAGREKSKLFPTDIGGLVNDFLVENFGDILSYNFTANIEKEFDKIADGEMIWTKMIGKFYPPFHKQVVKTTETSRKPTGERILGTDPVTGRQVSVRIGRYGPMVQIGTAEEEEKPKFASLMKEQSIKTLSLEEALGLFRLPREIGKFENVEVIIGVGKFGPYARHQNIFYSLEKSDDPLTIVLERAIEVIETKREKDKNKVVRTFREDADLQVLNGRWGPYIKYKKENFRIPKGQKAEELDFNKCFDIINKGREKKK